MWLIDSPWFVGIVASLPSGLIVYGITSLFETRRRGRQLRERVNLANADVLQALRNLIGDNVLPQAAVIDALLNCSARRHSVNKEDLFAPRQIADEIITEILNNPFLSPRQKNENCGFVLQIVEATDAHFDRVEITKRFEADGRRDLSLVLAVITFVSVLLGIVSANLGTGTVSINKESLTFMAVAIILPTLAFWLTTLYRDIQKFRTSRREYVRTMLAPEEKEFHSDDR
jgi:hypothetical protein